jgi:hypothetical protein
MIGAGPDPRGQLSGTAEPGDVTSGYRTLGDREASASITAGGATPTSSDADAPTAEYS